MAELGDHLPPSQIERIRLDKAARDEGFGIPRPDQGDWLAYDSLGCPASIRLTCADGEYMVAVNHTGVARDLAERWTRWPADRQPAPPAEFNAFVINDTALLHRLVDEIWHLGRALPNAPLKEFEEKTRTLPRTTEAERLVIQRVGQDVFRDALLTYWGGRCAVTGVAEPRLLRASHIKPWAACESDAERLDVYNGLLLAAHLDAAFDAGLISFQDDGAILISAKFNEADRQALGVHSGLSVSRFVDAHLQRLAWHRMHIFVAE